MRKVLLAGGLALTLPITSPITTPPALAAGNALSEALHNQTELGTQAEITHNLAKAEGYFRQALATANQIGPASQEHYAGSARLAAVLVLEGKLDEAEPFYKELVGFVKDARKKAQPDPELLFWLDDLGDAYQEESHKGRQDFCLERVVSLRETIAPGKHTKLASACRQLATMRIKEGRFADAERLYAEAIELTKYKFGAKAKYYDELALMASTQEQQHKYAEAKANFEKAIADMSTAGEPAAKITQVKQQLAKVQSKLNQSKH